MKHSDDELRMQIDALIRDNIQEVINDYVDEKDESVKESGLGFVKKEGEDNQLKVNISKDEVDKLIHEYKKIKRQQKSNFSEIKKLDLLDKDGRPLQQMNYKDAGVDVEAGNAFVEQLKKEAPSIGGFGGMFKVPRGYEEPVLVSGTDGVGTQMNICRVAGDYTTIGIDLVAMCVNDVITCGANPLYFLDYVST